MKRVYFLIMRLFGRMPRSRVYMWAYMRCLRTYMAEDPISGYWTFTEDYFAKSRK